MNHQTRFAWSFLLAGLLHVAAATLLMRFGCLCSAQNTFEAADNLLSGVTMVAVATSEVYDLTTTKSLHNTPQQPEGQDLSEKNYYQQEEESTKKSVITTQDQSSEKINSHNYKMKHKPETVTKLSEPTTIKAPSNNDQDKLFKNKQLVNTVFRTFKKPEPGSSQQYDFEPVLINNPRPPYPSQARLEGAEGTVYIKVTVDISGKISEASIIRSSGRKDFDDAAINTVREKWRFRPARLGNHPVPSEKHISIEFQLR